MSGLYDLHVSPEEPWRDDPAETEWYARTYAPPALDRLTHLVLVDGRLVDLWTEPVRGTRWQTYADRFDAEREPAPVPVNRPAAYDAALAWLRTLVGGAQVLDDLDAAPVRAGTAPALPSVPQPLHRRVEETQALLDAVTDTVVDDPEIHLVLRRGLHTVVERDPAVVSGARSAAHLAAGVLHAVGRANGLFAPVGSLTQREVAAILGLRGSLAQRSSAVEEVLRGFREPAMRPHQLPDLLPLGEAGLLTSSTRSRVLTWRDRAESARREALASPQANAAGSAS